MMKFFLIFSVILFSCQPNIEDPSLRQAQKIGDSEKLNGRQLYQKHCLVCHQSDAFGLKGVFPPIKNSDYFLEDPKRAIQNILYGQTEAIIVNGEKYHGLMPAIKINDDDLLELVNYLLEDVNAVEDRVNLKDIEWVRQNH